MTAPRPSLDKVGVYLARDPEVLHLDRLVRHHRNGAEPHDRLDLLAPGMFAEQSCEKELVASADAVIEDHLIRQQHGLIDGPKRSVAWDGHADGRDIGRWMACPRRLGCFEIHIAVNRAEADEKRPELLAVVEYVLGCDGVDGVRDRYEEGGTKQSLADR
jgi:hypothetical protein